jgi:hypothetical protein
MRGFLSVTVTATVLLAACGSNSDSSTSPSGASTSTFQGTIAGTATQSGTLSVTVQSKVAAASPLALRLPFIATLYAQASTVSASGSLHIVGGSTTTLSGSFDTSAKTINLSGGGFTFLGSLGGSVMSGSYTGPNSASGGFSSLSTTSSTVTLYCGNVFGVPPQSSVVTGVLNLSVASSGTVSGSFSVLPDDSGTISGQVTGTNISITYVDSAGTHKGETGTATGTIQNGAVSGTSSSGNPFSGSTSKCQ